MWALLAACSEPEDLAPTAPAAPPDRADLAPFRGRWRLVGDQDGALALRTACPGRTLAFVEIRGDAVDGWELVTGQDDELRILPIGAVEPKPDGVIVRVEGEPGVDVVWVEPGRIAQFPSLYGE